MDWRHFDEVHLARLSDRQAGIGHHARDALQVRARQLRVEPELGEGEPQWAAILNVFLFQGGGKDRILKVDDTDGAEANAIISLSGSMPARSPAISRRLCHQKISDDTGAESAVCRKLTWFIARNTRRIVWESTNLSFLVDKPRVALLHVPPYLFELRSLSRD